MLKDIDVNEFKSMIQNGDSELIDVRTPAEHDEARISNSENINVMDPYFSSDIEDKDKAKTYLVYCKSGGRSRNAAMMMSNMGFEKVYNLEGGITEWINQGNDVE